MAKKGTRLTQFDFQPGERLAGKYEVISKLGEGWEGEVYLIREWGTRIERAAKFFFPQRNIRNRTARAYAKKLHKLRHCPMVIRYYTQEVIHVQGIPVTCIISEYDQGELLTHFLRRQPGKKLSPFQAVHLLHTLATGVEHIHLLKEYHGDLHPDNIIVEHYGLGFEIKLLDMFNWGVAKKANIRDDICDMIRIFYDCLGGYKHYAKQPPEVKWICGGLKRSLILRRFKSATHLRNHLETMEWS